MELKALPRQRPVPSSVTVLAFIALAVTVAYFAGLVPGIPKTLPMFVDILQVTIVLFIVAGLAWVVSFFIS